MSYNRLIDDLMAFCERLDPNEYPNWLPNGALDEHYQVLESVLAWLHRLIPIHVEPELFTDVIRKLDRKREEILDFYLTYFEDNDVIGDSDVLYHADYIFVLASKHMEILLDRARHAVRFIRNRPKAIIILCGGGFMCQQTESEQMLAFLQSQDDLGLTPERVVIEDDSIDTVGNAVLSKLKLRQKKLLAPSGKLMLVTSDFHAIRAIHIFRRVYGSGYSIALARVPSNYTAEKKRQFAAHELKSDSESCRGIFSINYFVGMALRPHDSIKLGDERTYFYQMILEHEYYRHRYDLIRKYQDVLR